jgi:hypothetical protein
MRARITLQYRIIEDEPRQPDWSTEADVTCPTELTNLAYEYLRQSRADNVNFYFTEAL